MSIPTKEQANRFLAPLRGSLTILLLHDIQAKMQLTRFLLQCAHLQSADTTVLDADAFYCTNINRFAEDAKSVAKAELLLLPEQGFEVASLLPLLSSKREMLIIDDLNSLYSLASDGRRSHQLTVLMRLLSHNARMNRSWVVATTYKTNLGNKQGAASQRSLTSLGDLLLDTELRGTSLWLKASFKGQWPNGEFSL
jgi:hypothetical protein